MPAGFIVDGRVAFIVDGWRVFPDHRLVRRTTGLRFQRRLRELKALSTDGLSEDHFQLTRKFLRNYLLHYASTTMERLAYALDDRFYGLDGSHLARFRRMMNELSREEVNAAVRKRDPNHLNLGMRFGGHPPEEMSRAARAFDVYSINIYDYSPGREAIDRAYALAGRPASLRAVAVSGEVSLSASTTHPPPMDL